MFEKNNPLTLRAWCMYDWANSVYSLVITSTIFPIYFLAVAVSGSGSDMISFFGFTLKNSVIYSYALSFTFLFVAFTAPFFSGIADYLGRKKTFMEVFCLLGSLSCMALYFFTSGRVEWGVVFFVLAGIGYSGSLVFYNSFLPEIATPDIQDKISARGFAYGYAGSVLLLLFNLSMLLFPELYGNISSGMASRISFLSVGIWWLFFSRITFARLKNNVHNRTPDTRYAWLNGYRELKAVSIQLQNVPGLKLFLGGFFFYGAGVQTVMYVAAIFGEKELHLPSSNLIVTVLILQLVAIPGALLFSKISEKTGNINALLMLVGIWIAICVGAYYVSNGNSFYILAGVVGFVMGGIQSLSRSTYSKMLPETQDTASFFSFYDSTEKLSIVVGTLSYGLIDQFTGSMRYSVLVLGFYFIIGAIFLFKIKKINFPLFKTFTRAKTEFR